MYANYFSSVVKSQGIPHLNPTQFIRYQNIVAIEFHLKKLRILLKEYKDNREVFMQIFKIEMQLTELTGNLKPEDLLKEMIRLSNH